MSSYILMKVHFKVNYLYMFRNCIISTALTNQHKIHIETDIDFKRTEDHQSDLNIGLNVKIICLRIMLIGPSKDVMVLCTQR